MIKLAMGLAIVVGCSHPPPVFVPASTDLALDYVGPRSLFDRTNRVVYALGKGEVLAIDATSGEPTWKRPVTADRFGNAGPYLTAIGGDMKQQTLTLFSANGDQVATCLFVIPPRTSANAVGLRTFGVNGKVYVFYETYRTVLGGGHPPDDAELRRRHEADAEARSCGLLAFDLGASCTGRPDDLARFSLESCSSPEPSQHYMARIQKLLGAPLPKDAPVVERTREVQVSANYDRDNVTSLVGVDGTQERWTIELARERVIDEPP